jgi:hypothetical protein
MIIVHAEKLSERCIREESIERTYNGRRNVPDVSRLGQISRTKNIPERESGLTNTVRQQPGVDTDENEENREDEGLDRQEARVERSDASYVTLINDLITAAKCVRPAIRTTSGCLPRRMDDILTARTSSVPLLSVQSWS